MSGTVTNSVTGQPIVGATIDLVPDAIGASLVTDAAGHYAATVPIGTYTVQCQAVNYGDWTHVQSLVAGMDVVKDFAMVPVASVMVTITGAPASPATGSSFPLTADVTVMDGSTITGYQWSETTGTGAGIASATSPTATVQLAAADVYKAAVLSHVKSPRRWGVVGLSPFALEEGGDTAIRVDVTTTSGTYVGTVHVVPAMGFAVVNLGIRNVPRGVPVLLNSADISPTAYAWAFALRPTGSTAAFDDPTDPHPSFVPDVAGEYRVSPYPAATAAEQVTVFAGTWAGAITSLGGDGKPESGLCTFCHNGTIVPDKFTDWRESGHAHIFSSQLDTSTHYGEGCFSCHTVGFDKAVTNGGIDDQGDYAAFLGSGLLNHPGNNWATVVGSFPNTARLANIQCESCHGPNGSQAHGWTDADPKTDPRVSLSADVCGSCHGEPLRHARFQQWEESGHGNFDLALSRSTSTSCARCHTAEGYLTWLPRLLAGNNGSLTSGDLANWTKNTVHPITCAVCHPPHDPGSTSGIGTDVTLRVDGSTPMLPSGFAATNVGHGAMCITCHNTRNGSHNDWTQPLGVVSVDDQAPHTAAQADVVMGENAYFMDQAERSPHSLIKDSCVTCHMELSPPPAELSYNQTGSNHDFAASLDICSNCHGAFDAANLQAHYEEELHLLATDLEDAIRYELAAQLDPVTRPGWYWKLSSGSTVIQIYDVAAIEALALVETQGRQGAQITLGGLTVSSRLSSIQLYDGMNVSQGTFIAQSGSRGQVLLRAGWNYWLLHGDNSKGVHHPAFYGDVIGRSRTELANAYP
jgi:hypothetical protein